MPLISEPHDPAVDDLPWFRARPRLTLAVAVVLFAGVLALRLLVGGPNDALNLLYALPVSLLAMTFGRRAGTAAGLAAVALVVLWALLREVHLGALAWASRALPLLLLGYLLGDATDRLRSANERRRALEAAAQRHRDAVEINDTLVQGMAAAKWALEAGRHDAGLRTLDQTLNLGHELVSKLMRDADMGTTSSSWTAELSPQSSER